MRSTILFLIMLYFVHSTTTESQMELENNPAFVELSANPISQAFFSAAALRIREEGSSKGFQKIMALMNELIHDNHRQIQKIRKINASTQSECVVVTHKLKDRAIFFAGQTKYFKRRGSVTIEEKTEAVNVRDSRLAQNTSFGALLTAATARNGRKLKKWGDRCTNNRLAVDKSNSAIRVVNEWTPKSSVSLIQKTIRETADLYKSVKNYPLTVPEELIQLAANDRKLRKRLFQWLNFLKSSLVSSLASCQRSQNSIIRLHTSLKNTITSLRNALSDDAKKLSQMIENYTILIKVYSQNEGIYSNLSDQNNLLVQANNNYCATEAANFKAGERMMEAQLRTFTDLRFWLRKNFSRVRDWLKQKYAN